MQAKCPAEERSCPSAGPRMPFERPVSEGAVVSRSGRRGVRQVRQYQSLATPWLAGGADVRVLSMRERRAGSLCAYCDIALYKGLREIEYINVLI